MNRTIDYHITARNNGRSIKEFLREKGYSSQNLIQLKKQPAAFCLNGQAVFYNAVLQEGDLLRVFIQEETSSEKIAPIPLPLDIVYEDDDFMVINKPAGMPIHLSQNHYDNTLANALAWYFEQKNMPFIFRCVNRLDKDTSGLTIIAKHMVSAGILSSMTARREVCREYLAIIQGIVEPQNGTVDAPIGRKSGSIIERTVDWEHGEHAVTHYRTLNVQNGYSLLSLRLETGRTHQIRVHMQSLGFPLAGDTLYGSECIAIHRQALHSHRLTFPHPITGEIMDFICPLPADMQILL